MLKDLLIKNKKIHYLGYTLKKINDKNYIERTLYPEINPYSLITEERGDAHEGEVFGEVSCFPMSGFGAALMNTVLCVYYCHLMGLSPYVSFPKDWILTERTEINGTMNPFQYYYRQLSDIGEQDIQKVKRVAIISPHMSYCMKRYIDAECGDEYHYSEKVLRKMGEIYSRYFKLNATVDLMLQEDRKMLGDMTRCLGLHIRRGGMQLGATGHPNLPEFTDYMQAVNILLEKGEYNKVFLSTDDKATVEMVRNALDVEVLAYDCVRSEGAYDNWMDPVSERINHKYLSGYEVLRDCYGMADCSSLVMGLSKVPWLSRVIKRSKGEDFGACVVIDKGLVQKGVDPGKTYDLGIANAKMLDTPGFRMQKCKESL